MLGSAASARAMAMRWPDRRELPRSAVGEFVGVHRVQPARGDGSGVGPAVYPCSAVRRRRWPPHSGAEEHRLLGEHRHPRWWMGTKTPAAVSVRTLSPSTIRAWSGRSSPAIPGQQRRLACAVRAQDREHIPAGELEVEFGAALGQAGLESRPLTACRRIVGMRRR